MKITNNKSAILSQKLLIDALLTLMKEKKYSQITVSELTEKADLSRRTFYRLFSSIDEILLFYIHTLWSQKSSELYDSENISYMDISRFSLDFWYEHKDLTILLYENDLSNIILKFINEISLEIYKHQQPSEQFEKNPEAMEYALAYSSGGVHNIICTWASHGMDKTPAQLMQMFQYTLSSNI